MTKGFARNRQSWNSQLGYFLVHWDITYFHGIGNNHTFGPQDGMRSQPLISRNLVPAVASLLLNDDLIIAVQHRDDSRPDLQILADDME